MRKVQRLKMPGKIAPKNVQALFPFPKIMQKGNLDYKLKEINERLMALDKGANGDMEFHEDELSEDIPQFPGYLSSDDTFDPQFSRAECSPRESQRKAFFTIRIPESTEWNMAQSLDGHCCESGRDILFKSRINSSYFAEFPCLNYIGTSFQTLIELLAQGGYYIRLVGVASRGRFNVKGIHILNEVPVSHDSHTSGPFVHQSGTVFGPLSDEHLQIIIDRLLGSQPSNGDVFAPASELPYFSTKHELAFLFKACRHTYPTAVQKWAEYSFSSLDNSQLSSDDKRHTTKALYYVLNIDWSIKKVAIPELSIIKQQLDERFLGLEKVKERILEAAAQMRQTNSLPKWGILLHGPAGVGKTSIANAISEILGMSKACIEFSVIRDSEGLTGSSRIYGNASPGMIINQLHAHRSANLVMVLNEIDKAAGAKDRGNPLDVLLPLLDGMGFTDTYLEVTVPTQGLFFIATCNEIEKISKPILDRFFRIDIPAYSTSEKTEIFEKYIMPKVLRSSCVDSSEVSITKEAQTELIKKYAIEPGVRDLERYAEKLVTNYLMKKEMCKIRHVDFTQDDLPHLLGPPKALSRNIASIPGQVFSAFIHDGSAYIISIQAIVRQGKGELKILNIDSPTQIEYCRMAYEHVKSLIPQRLNDMDVVIALNQPISDSRYNYVGLATVAAIFSAIRGIAFPKENLFFGGCDLLGTLYLDDNDFTPLLRSMENKFDVLYTSFGALSRIPNLEQFASVKIIEVPNTNVLLSLSGLSNE